MSRQLAFDLPATPSYRREDFFVSPSNAPALRAVEGWAGWPLGKLALAGPSGSGKTHLARLWAAEAGAAVVAGADLAGADIPILCARGRVAVDGAEAVAGHPAGETALFHLHNHLLADHMQPGGGRLLLTGRRPPALWPVALPDLASRLAATRPERLAPPDDTLLSAVLVKLFADRQIAVAPELIGYLIARMERSLSAARDLVARLDAAALAAGRPVTRALARTVLDSPPDSKR